MLFCVYISAELCEAKLIYSRQELIIYRQQSRADVTTDFHWTHGIPADTARPQSLRGLLWAPTGNADGVERGSRSGPTSQAKETPPQTTTPEHPPLQCQAHRTQHGIYMELLLQTRLLCTYNHRIMATCGYS